MKSTMVVATLILALASGLATAQERPRSVTWWATTGDSTLAALVARGLEANQSVLAARARVRSAHAVRSAAALELAPIVNAEGAFARQRLSGAAFPGAGGGSLPSQDVWSAGLQLAWELDVFGRTRRAVQARGAYVAAAQEDVRDAQVLLAAELAAAYYDLRGAQERLESARSNAVNQRRTLALTLERLEAGRGNAFDSERARAQLSTTLAEIPVLEAAISSALSRMALLTGDGPEQWRHLANGPATPPALPDSIFVDRTDSLIRNRADVRAAERRLQARRALVGSASAQYLPRLSIAGSAGFTSGTAGSLGNSGTARYVIGPVVSWPALDLGRVKAGVDEARADEAEAAARYQQARLAAAGEIETAVVSYGAARERLRHLEDAAAASERAAELARIRYREGAADFLQVLDAERTLLAAQDGRAGARTQAHRALVEVYRAVGGAM